MQTNLETRFFKSLELRVKKGEGNTFDVSGHAAVFNSMSEDMGFREIIRPGAFSATLKKNPDVRLLLNHDGLPLARTISGTLKLSEDDKGLKFDATLDGSDPDVQRIIPKVNRGDLSQMSFAFRTITDAWRMENGQEIRELIELDLNDGDVSLVTYPAYTQTDVMVRSRELAKKSHDKWKQVPLAVKYAAARA